MTFVCSNILYFYSLFKHYINCFEPVYMCHVLNVRIKILYWSNLLTIAQLINSSTFESGRKVMLSTVRDLIWCPCWGVDHVSIGRHDHQNKDLSWVWGEWLQTGPQLRSAPVSGTAPHCKDGSTLYRWYLMEGQNSRQLDQQKILLV